MKKLLRTISAMLAISLLPVGAVFAEGGTSEYDDELVTFIVQTDYTPAAVVEAQAASGAKRGLLKGGRAADPAAELEKKNEEIRDAAAKELGVAPEGDVFTQLNSGFTITCRRGDMDRILAMDGVISVEEDQLIELVPDDEINVAGINGINSAVDLSPTDENYRGQGTLIAIVDSGFAVDHAYFSADISNPKYSSEDIDDIKTKKLTAKDGAYYSEKIPFIYNYVTETAKVEDLKINADHGTHVAGIAAGKNGTLQNGDVINGAAPEAQLALLACSATAGASSVNTAAMVKALNDVPLLGADVVNISIGGAYVDVRSGGSVYTAIKNARAAGIVVCTSQGNAGIGIYNNAPLPENVDYGSAGAYGNYTHSFSVAAAYVDVQYQELVNLVTGDGATIAASECADAETVGEFAAIVASATDYIDCGTGQAEDFDGETLTGKIALIQRGGNGFKDKTTYAKNAGAIAAIVYDNTDAGMYINMGGCVLPSVFVTKADGNTLKNASLKTIYSNGKTAGKFNTNPALAGKPTSFSSWGFSETMELTPSITGYGGLVYSAAPDGGYQSMSGTSMSSPNLAGASACVKSYLNAQNSTLTKASLADRIRQMLMTTAIPIRYYEDDTITYSPRLQGAGMVSIDNALKQPVVLYNSSGKTLVNLGDGIDSSFTLSFTAENLSDMPVTFDTVSVEVTTDNISEDGKVSGARKLTAEPSTAPVTVPANGTAEVSIDVTLNSSELAEIAKTFTNGFYIDGFVRFSNDEIYAGLPFSGFRGDWGSVPIWDSTIYDEDGSKLIYTSDNASVNGTYLTTNENSKSVKIANSKRQIVLSPVNADGYHDTLAAVFAMYRASNGIKLSLVQDESEQYSKEYTGYFSKYTNYESYTIKKVKYLYSIAQTEEEKNSLYALPDGDYTFRMTGYFDKGSGEPTVQNLDFPLTITIDNTPPEISMTLSEDYNTLEVAAEDAHSIKSVTVNYKDNDGNDQTAAMPVNGKRTSESYTFTLTDANPWTISVTAVDSENNSSASEEYAMTAKDGDNKATAFKRTLSGGSDATYKGVSGTVTSEGVTKSFAADFDTALTPSGGNVLIGVIVEGLYDNKATAEFKLR